MKKRINKIRINCCVAIVSIVFVLLGSACGGGGGSSSASPAQNQSAPNETVVSGRA